MNNLEGERKMAYDPDPRRKRRRKGKSRRGRVPPQLRAWVFGRRKGRTHDPKRRGMYYGYGTIRGKPYRIGTRGGVAWSGGRKPRYDPDRRGFRARAKGLLGKLSQKFDKIGTGLGFLLTFGTATWNTYDYLRTNYPETVRDPASALNEMVIKEATIFASDPFGHLQRKFLQPNHWYYPFWGSVGLWLTSKVLSYTGYLSKINRFLKPLSRGMLIGATVGALFVHGSYVGGNSTTHTDIMPTTSAVEMAHYG